MNLIQLKYFHAVCVHRTVTDAAESLYISQPSLSAAIKELEREFGVTLFRRHHSGMTLTAEGEVLYRSTKDILDKALQVENIMKDLGTAKKTLRLGIPPMISSLILCRLHREFFAVSSEIVPEITECGQHELYKMLDENTIDMAILPHSRPIGAGLASMHICSPTLVCCSKKGSPLTEYSVLSPKDLENTPLVLFDNSYFQTEMIKKWFSDANVTPYIFHQTGQLSTMLNLIGSGLAAGFGFSELARTHRELCAIPLDAPMSVGISLVWKKEGYFFSAMKKFREYASELRYL